MLINKEIDAGQMMAYLTATQIIQRSFAQVSILFGQALRGMSSGARVFEVNNNHYLVILVSHFNLKSVSVLFKNFFLSIFANQSLVLGSIEKLFKKIASLVRLFNRLETSLSDLIKNSASKFDFNIIDYF